MHRRRLLGLLTAALLLLPSGALAADGPGATALEVGDLVTVSESGDGEATALEVGGTQVAGTQGDGEGNAASTGDLGVPQDAASADVLASEVDSESSGASAADATVGGEDGLHVEVLSSERDGDRASTTGVAVAGGDRELALLTSSADGSSGSTALLDADGERVGDNTQDGDRLCSGEAPLVLDGQLLCAAGGEDGGRAHVADDLTIEQLAAQTGLSIDVLRANGVGSPGFVTSDSPAPTRTAAVPTATIQPAPAPTPAAPAPSAPGPAAPAAPTGGSLPVTGAPALVLLAAGLGLTATGGAMVRRRR